MSHLCRNSLLTVTVLFICSIFITATISGKQFSISLNAGQDQAQKISSWVLQHTSESESASFLVILKDKADLSNSATMRSKTEKGRFVRNALYAQAARSQGPLLDWLQARKIEHQSFYIVNAILVTGNRSIVEQIAARDDVDRIEGNPIIRNQLRVQPTVEELAAFARRVAAPQAIEPGVSYIRAPEVWNMGFTGQGIVIGGADTGIQWNHPALINKYRGWNGASATHDYNWHDSVHSGGGACGPNTTAPCDDDDHGTHTVGTVLGADAGNVNQIGVAPGAKFIGCRNMNQGNGTPATYLECMEWFLAPYPVGGTTAQGDPAKAPDLTTNSWGCPPSEGCSPGTLQQAVEAQRAAGIMFVAAAGNSGSGCATVSDPPSFYDATYTIGAISSATGTIASFSSRGPSLADGSNRIKPDISAPGVNVRSAIRSNAYASLSGTSMATPHTAGAIALLWSARPDLKNQILATENILNETAVDVSSTLCNSAGVPNNVYGWGRLDIKAAVDQGAASISPVSQNVPAAGAIGTVSVTAPAGFNWSSASNAPWISVISGNGVGNGTVTYSVFANSGPARTGTVLIAGNLFTVNQAAQVVASGRARKTDFDGDGRSDLSVWRGLPGDWRVLLSSTSQPLNFTWGSALAPYNDIPVPGDYDGDGKTDYAVWRPAEGYWYIVRSSDSQYQFVNWGSGIAPYNDLPVPGDYDGDGKTDIAVWRQADGYWYILRSSDSQVSALRWGSASLPYNDLPVQADYDGDGKTDIGIWRRQTGDWYIIRSANNQILSMAWGAAAAPYNDQAVPADYDGDGKADIGIWRRQDASWYIVRSSDGQLQYAPLETAGSLSSDVPVPADYDGDGKTDYAVWRPADGSWQIRFSSTGLTSTTIHGQNGDIPLPSVQR